MEGRHMSLMVVPIKQVTKAAKPQQPKPAAEKAPEEPAAADTNADEQS